MSDPDLQLDLLAQYTSHFKTVFSGALCARLISMNQKRVFEFSNTRCFVKGTSLLKLYHICGFNRRVPAVFVVCILRPRFSLERCSHGLHRLDHLSFSSLYRHFTRCFTIELKRLQSVPLFISQWSMLRVLFCIVCALFASLLATGYYVGMPSAVCASLLSDP